jgi:hypothetical protein
LLLCAVVLVTAARSGESARSKDMTDLTPPPSPQIKASPKTPIAVKKEELEGSNPWDPSWDVMIEKALPREMLSKDRAGAVRDLCPRFGTMTLANRRAFWAYFFQALAAAEAGLKPTADVRHNDPEVAVMDTVSHRIVRQEGLLQLTYMDSRRYRCAFDWERDKNLPEHDPGKTILQPRNNLMCGLRILDNQLIAQHRPLLTDSSYWVTLRPSTISFEVFLKQMANVPAACGARMVQDKPSAPRSMPATTATENKLPVEPAPAEATREESSSPVAEDEVRVPPASLQ